MDILNGTMVLNKKKKQKIDVQLVENPNMHQVSPHYRTLPDGREIWVDGDGDTTVDTYDGWMQHNPDYRV